MKTQFKALYLKMYSNDGVKVNVLCYYIFSVTLLLNSSTSFSNFNFNGGKKKYCLSGSNFKKGPNQ